MTEDDAYCLTCIYSGKMRQSVYCRYIFIVGKMRGCKGGQDCIRKKTYADAKEKMIRERLSLYNQGLTDAQIARKQGVTPAAITHWRKSLDLASKANQHKKDMMEQRMQLYLQGCSDAEIAAQQGIAAETVETWRKRFRLKNNQGAKI